MVTLSQKDLGILSDLMTYESLACKKASYYAQNSTDEAFVKLCCGVAQKHEKRYNALLKFLG